MGDFLHSVSPATWVIFIVWVIIIVITVMYINNIPCEDLGLNEQECCWVKNYSGWIISILLIVLIYWIGNADGRRYAMRKM